MKRTLIFLLATAPLWAADFIVSRQSFPPEADGAVRISRYCAAEPDGILLFHPHENEYTAKQTAFHTLARRKRGCLLALEQSGSRYLTFPTETAAVQADPNRIYTAAGRAQNPAAETLAAFAEILQTRFGNTKLIIALHNNTDAATDIESYAVEALAGADAQVAVNPERDADDYFYVNSDAAFEFFRARGFNVVKQGGSVPDDGSLSVYAARTGLPYINIEAEFGHDAEQQEMLDAALEFAAQGK
ncbi:hypothetical protein [Neisseria chenwenguii]|uniref:Uncharacterized protein n=1 Tax=Neisseria chenwenguii TaxID=1853278 RepID=A0A220S1L0_9NEIS|nr:hypothetical protein [Neisseria chenwenguii]ASK27302.1 hypothetical protein BG910_05715 [Neisseria chenwenguii]ROV57023.1 hypothetical protein EGS38_02445 [Neisseria chenwenguii]